MIVAKAFAHAHRLSWNDSDVAVTEALVEGEAVWSILTNEPADPAALWFEQPKSPYFVTYFVAAENGCCIGFQHGSSPMFLQKGWGIGDAPAR